MSASEDIHPTIVTAPPTTPSPSKRRQQDQSIARAFYKINRIISKHSKDHV